MKVAIMGAGLSGLSCAIILDKYGHQPVIYENKSQVGDSLPRAEIMLPTFTRPIKNEMKYLYEKFGILLKPASSLRHVTFYSENSRADLIGKLGASTIRGNHPHSYENQLLNQVHSKIIYNSPSTYDTIKKSYSNVVVATGDPRYVSNLSSLRADLFLTVKGATIVGNYDRHHMYSWFDNMLSPKGFAFLTPLNNHQATIAIAFPSYLKNGNLSTNELWKRFLKRIYTDTGIPFEITKEFEMPNLILSRCLTPKVGTTYFTGNCLGAMGPAFGIGQFNAILSGIYAALDICGKGDYKKLTEKLFESYENSLTIRHTLENLNNQKLDGMVRLIDQPFVNKLILSKINVVKYLSLLLKVCHRQ